MLEIQQRSTLSFYRPSVAVMVAATLVLTTITAVAESLAAEQTLLLGGVFAAFGAVAFLLVSLLWAGIDSIPLALMNGAAAGLVMAIAALMLPFIPLGGFVGLIVRCVLLFGSYGFVVAKLGDVEVYEGALAALLAMGGAILFSAAMA